MRHFFTFLIFISLSCNKKKETLNASEICDCYEKSSETNFDSKLNSCIDFKKVTENFDMAAYQNEISKTIKTLIIECPKYQQDFNQNFITKFENHRPTLIAQKDSIIKCTELNIELAKNYSKLAEISIQEKNFTEALNFINKSLAIENGNEYSHWIKSYLFQKENDFENAIKEFEIMNIKADLGNKSFNLLMIENLKVQKKRQKASI